jgi:hypothetical protein
MPLIWINLWMNRGWRGWGFSLMLLQTTVDGMGTSMDEQWRTSMTICADKTETTKYASQWAMEHCSIIGIPRPVLENIRA